MFDSATNAWLSDSVWPISRKLGNAFGRSWGISKDPWAADQGCIFYILRIIDKTPLMYSINFVNLRIHICIGKAYLICICKTFGNEVYPLHIGIPPGSLRAFLFHPLVFNSFLITQSWSYPGQADGQTNRQTNGWIDGLDIWKGWTDRLKRWTDVFSIQRLEISVIKKSTKRNLKTQLNVYNIFLRHTSR